MTFKENEIKSYPRGWDGDLVCIFMSSSLLEEHWDQVHSAWLHKLHLKTQKKMELYVMNEFQMKQSDVQNAFYIIFFKEINM